MKVINIDGLETIFNSDMDFVRYAQNTWVENQEEKENSKIDYPVDKETAIKYISLYTEVELSID